jgi:hypothetical protein
MASTAFRRNGRRQMRATPACSATQPSSAQVSSQQARSKHANKPKDSCERQTKHRRRKQARRMAKWMPQNSNVFESRRSWMLKKTGSGKNSSISYLSPRRASSIVRIPSKVHR